MTNFQTLLNDLTIDALEDFNPAAARAAGLPDAKIREWADLHDFYYGPTSNEKVQRNALSEARKAATSLFTLGMIEREIKKVPGKRARDRLRLWALRTRLAYNDMLTQLKARIAKDGKPKRQKRYASSPSRDGLRTITATIDEHTAADLEHAARAKIDENSDVPENVQMAEAFEQILRDGKSLPTPTRHTTILIPLDQYEEIIAGNGDDVLLGCTDGTRITGAEYLAKHHGERLSIAVFHPEEGPVNLYRAQRLASPKQRALVKATSPMCAFSGCRRPADDCQLHHITPWKHGGETNLDNLAPLCEYHNHINDDDTDAPTAPSNRVSAPGKAKPRGRIIKKHGRICYQSPYGRVSVNNIHPYNAMDLLFGPVDFRRSAAAKDAMPSG